MAVHEGTSSPLFRSKRMQYIMKTSVILTQCEYAPHFIETVRFFALYPTGYQSSVSWATTDTITVVVHVDTCQKNA